MGDFEGGKGEETARLGGDEGRLLEAETFQRRNLRCLDSR